MLPVQNNLQTNTNFSGFGVNSAFKSKYYFLILISGSAILLLVTLFFIFQLSKPNVAQANKLNRIAAETTSLRQPLAPRVSSELFKQQQQDIAIYTKNINEAFAKGDIETARTNLLKLKDTIWQLGDPLKGILPSKELKAQHDPQDKYLKFDDIDPAIEDWYLSVVDTLVKLDLTK